MLGYEHASRVTNFTAEEYQGHISAETCAGSVQWCFGHMWYKQPKKKKKIELFVFFSPPPPLTTMGMNCNC